MDRVARSHRVGIRLADWSHGYSLRIFRGIVEFTRSGHPLDLVFGHASGGELPDLRIGCDWDGDGLIVFRPRPEEVSSWRKRGIAVINLSSETSIGAQPVPQVTMDNHACGMLAADHLGSLGLRHFAFWHDPHRTYSCERLAGFHEGLCAARRQPPLVVPIPASSFPKKELASRIAASADKALSSLDLPCGLFAKDDIAAIHAIRALQRLGLRVPQDVAVLGVSDDILFCHGSQPPLSSIRFPGRKIGRAAADLLFQLMSGQLAHDAPHRITIPPAGVVPRESTGRIDLPDPICARALDIIRSIAPKRSLSTEEICRLSGSSREALRLRFHETFGRTIKEMVDQTRIDTVCDMLRHTDWTLDRISEASGFGSGEDLSRFFKRMKGISPGRWRHGLE